MGRSVNLISTSDLRTLIEYVDEVIEGVRIIDEVFGVEKIYFGLEDDMMEAAEVLRRKD